MTLNFRYDDTKSLMDQINKNIQHREKNELIVVGNPKWRIGVLGLVATRLVEQYQKPI